MAIPNPYSSWYLNDNLLDEFGDRNLSESSPTAYVAGVSAGTGNAANFNNVSHTFIPFGSEDQLNIGNNDFSISMWVKSNNGSDAFFDGLMSFGNLAGPKRGYLLYTKASTNQILFFCSSNGSNALQITKTLAGGINTGEWHHIVTTFDASTDTIALIVDDGTPVTRNDVTDIFQPDNSDSGKTVQFGVGNYYNNLAVNHYNGVMDSVYFFTEVISAADITELNNGGNGFEKAAVIPYRRNIFSDGNLSPSYQMRVGGQF